MVRGLYVLGSCAMLAACAVFGFWLLEQNREDPHLEEIRNRPSAVERFKESDGQGRGLPDGATPPLIVQAEAFARYLDPPKSPYKPSASVLPGNATLPVPTIRPVAPSVKFTLHGTSYYPNQPSRSMALIAELGAAEGNERWVKEGSQVGHFVIHEIRHGAIVYRDGDNLQEMALEPGMNTPMPVVVV